MDILALLPKGLKIESPFTWKLDQKQVRDFNEEDIVLADYEESSITRFVEMNTFAYIRCAQGKIDGAEKLIKEINDLWKNISESISKDKDLSVDVLMHIKDTTAYCIFLSAGKKDQAKALEIKIKDANDFTSDIEKGTMFGSQALALALFNEHILNSAVKLAKLAVSCTPNCAVWHYVIAKCLRKKRRQNSVWNVSREEQNEFLMCYKLSPSDHYGMSAARMYKESRNWKKCSEIYNEIYRRGPTNIKVRLILALCFMNSKDFVKAKNCLDYIERLLPAEKRSKTYYHYLGKYYEKTGNKLKVKENYLKAIGETGNFPADMDYFNFIKNSSKNNEDAIKHLQNMLERYENRKGYTVNILLNLAFIYLFENNDKKLAAEYFLKAVKTNPLDPQLKDFRGPFQFKIKYNIFQLIRQNILTEYNKSYGTTLKELKNYCIEYENQKQNSNALDSLDKKFAKALSLKE
ncbi:uncharacterized protein LOC106656885 [Trichogramma pretiosum]|uniref:uncharacterized protein LOC106656885 n=1 Tax=Trichogramma pretiosum TaxID=7493 RepID=UPI0006C9A9C8|nr:uncharacterized protein LOC106656885 [Trichogramma pretiosum]